MRIRFILGVSHETMKRIQRACRAAVNLRATANNTQSANSESCTLLL